MVYGRYNELVHGGYIGKPTQWEFQDKMEVTCLRTIFLAIFCGDIP